MAAQLAGVVAGAVDERGLAPPQELQPHDIQAGRDNDTAVMANPSLAIENRYVQPRIVRSEARRPYNRPDLLAGEIQGERRPRLDFGRRETMRRIDLVVETVGACPRIDRAQ